MYVITTRLNKAGVCMAKYYIREKNYLLQMSLLSKVDTTRSTLEGSDTFVDPLVHVPVAGRREYLETVAQLTI